MKLIFLPQIVRWLLPLWAMAAIFDTENNECSQDDYVAPIFAVTDDSGVGTAAIIFVHINVSGLSLRFQVAG